MYALEIRIGRNIGQEYLDPFLTVPDSKVTVALDDHEWSNFKKDVSRVLSPILNEPEFYGVDSVNRIHEGRTVWGDDVEETFIITVNFTIDVFGRDPSLPRIIGSKLEELKDEYFQDSIYVVYGFSEFL